MCVQVKESRLAHHTSDMAGRLRTHMVMIVLSHFLPHVTVEKFEKS